MKSFLKIFTAVILSFLFIAMAAAYFGIYAVRSKASNSDFYKEQLRANDVYERAYTDILPSLIRSKGDNNAGNLFGGLEDKFRLSDSDIENLGRLLIHREEFLIPNVERLLDNSLDYLTNKTDDPDLTVDLTSIKTRAPGIITDFALNLVRNLPECTPEKRLVVNDLLLFQQGVLPTCFSELAVDAQTRAGVKAATGIDLPPRLTRDNFQPLLRDALETQVRNSVAEMPDHLDLITEIAEQDNTSREEVLSDFDSARTAFGFTTGAGLILLAILMLLVLVALYFLLRFSPIEPFMWIGATVGLVGVIALTAALAAKSSVNGIIQKEKFSEDQPEISAMLRDLFTSISNSVANGIVLQSAVFLISGLVIIGISIYIIRKRKILTSKS